MSKEKRNFRLKMNLVCGSDDLRPVMQHVYFKDGKMLATDAHILIKANTQKFSDFDKSEIDMLEGKFIHKSTFKKILSCAMVIITENGIQDMSTKDVYAFAQTDDKFPNIDSAIPSEYKEISEIGIGPQTCLKIMKVLSTPDIYNLSLNFSGQNKAITIKGLGDNEGALTAILMPVMLSI